MALTVGDIIRVAARQSWDVTEDVVNVFHFNIVAVPSPNTAAALLEDIGEHLSTAWAEIAPDLTNLLDPVDISVFNVSDDAPIGVGSWGAGYVGGTGSGEAMPPADALLILNSTGVKRRIGRIYLGGTLESQQAGGVWTAGMVADAGAFNAALTDLTTLSNGTQVQYIVYSRSGGVGSLVVSSRVVRQTAYQLRRKRGRGS